jgi:F-type H+-transporting ATPase subunit delta
MFTVCHYSQALFLAALKEKKLNRFLLDLELIKNVLKSNKDFWRFLVNPEISKSKKIKALKLIFGAKVLPQSYNLIFLLIKKNCLKLFSEILHRFRQLVLAAEKIQEAEIISSVPLPSIFRLRITKIIGKQIGKKVKLIEKINPKILGGIVVKVGDEVVDFSLKKKVEVLRENLS